MFFVFLFFVSRFYPLGDGLHFLYRLVNIFFRDESFEWKIRIFALVLILVLRFF